MPKPQTLGHAHWELDLMSPDARRCWSMLEWSKWKNSDRVTRWSKSSPPEIQNSHVMHAQIYIYIYIYVCVCILLYTHIYIYIDRLKYNLMFLYVYPEKNTYIYMYDMPVHHIHTHTHTYIYIHMHTLYNIVTSIHPLFHVCFPAG